MSKKSDVHPVSISKKKWPEFCKIKVKNQIIKLKYKNLNIYNVIAVALLSELNLNIKELLILLKLWTNWR